jgi:hypothetical protein
MNLQNRINLLQQLKDYLQQNDAEWQAVKAKAATYNGWFIPDFIDVAVNNICTYFLDADKLNQWVTHYHLDNNITPKNIGLVMAGNIPLVGFHDFLAVFISGHNQTIKLSSKDDVLLKHIVQKLYSWDISIQNHISFAEMLKGCDAYIATGSNNSARYFEQYFAKYPSIIRRNRTSVAILSGNETANELALLSDDIHTYFGLGCRNVTKLYVPEQYDFVPLLQSFEKYTYFADHNKYKNNYDYQLSLALMNNIYYMTNESTLLIENESIFSAISQLNYSFYKDAKQLTQTLTNNTDVQCIVGLNNMPFGNAQKPGLFNYADGVDTMQFLLSL